MTLYLLVELFRRYMNKTGPIWREFNQNAYYVYIIHLVVIGTLALPLRSVNLPLVVKYPLLAVATFLACTLIVSLLRRATTAGPSLSQPRPLPGSL